MQTYLWRIPKMIFVNNSLRHCSKLVSRKQEWFSKIWFFFLGGGVGDLGFLRWFSTRASIIGHLESRKLTGWKIRGRLENETPSSLEPPCSKVLEITLYTLESDDGVINRGKMIWASILGRMEGTSRNYDFARKGKNHNRRSSCPTNRDF